MREGKLGQKMVETLISPPHPTPMHYNPRPSSVRTRGQTHLSTCVATAMCPVAIMPCRGKLKV